MAVPVEGKWRAEGVAGGGGRWREAVAVDEIGGPRRRMNMRKAIYNGREDVRGSRTVLFVRDR